MAFKKKTWIDRMVEFAGRRKITNVSTSAAQIIDVERAECAVSQEGDAFSAENMNDLEKRISDAFADVPSGYKIADNDTTNNSEFLATARVAYEHGLEIDALSRDLSAMNDNGAITGMDAREDGVYITYVPADGADPVSKKLGSNGITYLGDMPYTCTQDYGDCTLLTFCHQKTATQNVTIKNLNGSYNIKQIVPAHIGGVLCFLAIVDVTNLNKGATIDTESSDTKRVFII